jgi:hypothetical protein
MNLLQKKSRVGAALLLILLACYGSYQAGRSLAARGTTRKVTPEIPLRAEPEHLNFGVVWEQRAFAWQLPIRNVSARDVTIAEFHSSCNCTVVEPKSLKIPPGETREVRLKIDLAPRLDAEAQFEREIVIQIAPISSSDAERLPTWTVRGRARSVVQFLAPLSFGEHSELGQPFAELVVPVRTLVPLKGLEATCANKRFAIQLMSVGANRYELRVKPTEKLPIGPFHCDIFLAAEGTENGAMPPLKTRVEGKIVRDIQPIEPAVVFGAGRVGTTFRETISLASLTGSTFDVERCDSSIPGLEVNPVDRYFGSFEVTLPCCGIGEQKSEISFLVRDEANEKWSLRVPLLYHGFNPESSSR